MRGRYVLESNNKNIFLSFFSRCENDRSNIGLSSYNNHYYIIVTVMHTLVCATLFYCKRVFRFLLLYVDFTHEI